ncbi:MAG: transposase [Candidatus Moranbacteria bacterium]|nr:transposase [Candidatus Moranbacteria bacterium]
MRKDVLTKHEYYHVYNRGVEKRNVFLCDKDYLRFLESMKEFNSTKPVYSLYLHNELKRKGVLDVGRLRKLVEVICYCLNPNHFHLILKQVEENGISEFMKRLGGGYTKYFNHHYKRSGVLFQGKFKSVRIKTNSHLLYLSAYVNKNYFIHGYGDDFDWPYSSLLDYTGKRHGRICDTSVILNQFENKNEYREFIKENSLYMKEKKEDEKYLLE